MNPLIPALALILIAGCTRSPSLAQQLCDSLRAEVESDFEYEIWDPPGDIRESMWSELKALVPALGGAEISGDPLCFLRAGPDRSAIVFRTEDGAERIQPYDRVDDVWLLDPGEDLVIWEVDRGSPQ